uniref:CCHC-type domain-containing protein n=1 Tax=Lactuca sativa TaxID=4236 RepID=A0A9R1VV55_LACSA|nr:hypothetical protein LSAT_V11C400215090 [Lactuca sativa]
MSGRPSRGRPQNETPDVAQVVAQQLMEAIPNIVTQVTAGLNANQGSSGGNRGNNERECKYKSFMACKPKEFHGKEGAVGLLKWIDSMESVLHISKCLERNKVEYASCLLQDRALTWWNTLVQTRGRTTAYQLTWEDLKKLLIEEYCPKDELQKLESEFWNHSMVRTQIEKYTVRFHELAKLVPHMVTPEEKRIDRYIWGLAPKIRGMVTSANPTTIQSAVSLANRLTNDVIRMGASTKESSSNKRKPANQGEKKYGGKSGRKQKVSRNFMVRAQEQEPVKTQGQEVQERKQYSGPLPKCNKCNFHHKGACPVCQNCKQTGYYSKYCKVNKEGKRTCYECGSTDHLRRACPKLNNGPGNNGQGQARQNFQGNQVGQPRGVAFVIGAEEARQNPEVITGTFLLNNHFASVIFDAGADRSFVSVAFRPLIGLKSVKMRNAYAIELADGYEIRANDIIPGCTLNLADKLFSIVLIPIELGSFDVIVGMDWLSKNRADIGCYEKVIRVPLPNGETLIIHGEKPGRSLNIVSSMKIHKYLKKNCIAFMAHVLEREPEAKQLKEVPVVQNYLEVFPEELPGLPPHRQVEFRIDLVPGAAPIAKLFLCMVYHTSIQCAPYEALYGRKCRSPLCWTEIGDRQLTRVELIQETSDKIAIIKDKLKAARDRQKSYADNRRKPLESK